MTDDEQIKLGDLRSSEKLIYDLYIDLRRRVNTWAAITGQTAQARMGYVGQHLVSVVTGYPGGKSGARGHDLVLPDGEYAEIKTCYRVDQLGRCNTCDARIASIERICPKCGSKDIRRNDDSKWLIGIRHDEEFSKIAEPKAYYLVLFDFIDLHSPDAIRSSIWQVDPKVPGFLFCMVDYRLNIQAKSRSKAPFNLWPYELKFCLMRPWLIYRSIISTSDDWITTEIFPGRDEPQLFRLKPLQEYSRSQNLSWEKIAIFGRSLGIDVNTTTQRSKRDTLAKIQEQIDRKNIDPVVVVDKLANALYLPDIKQHLDKVPDPLRRRVKHCLASEAELSDSG